MGSKYETDQQTIQQLESQLQSIQLMSLYNKKQRSMVDDSIEPRAYFINPSPSSHRPHCHLLLQRWYMSPHD
jgi:hypothetical protein